MKYRRLHHPFLETDDCLLIGGDAADPAFIRLHKQNDPLPEAWQEEPERHEAAVRWLDAYLQGKETPWPLPYPPKGTPFQQACWQVIAEVPRGSTISYTELACRVGKPDAVRAAASACGKNPLPLLIPCHRVLARQGTLGGFAWGLAYKQKLLALEAA